MYEEIRVFWERRGAARALEGLVPPPEMREVSPSSSAGGPDEWAAEREYLRFMANRPSDEELMEWVLRASPDEPVPSGYSEYP